MSDREPHHSPNALLMTDWSCDVEHLAPNRDALLDRLSLLSLVYDEVLVPDEVFALSDRLASWWGPDGDYSTLRQCVEMGSLRVMKLSQQWYSPALRELARTSPITARARRAQEASTKGAAPFEPTDRQKRFHAEMDAVLRDHPMTQREIRPAGSIDVLGCFGILFVEILTHPRYRRWLRDRFPGVTDDVRAGLLRLHANPRMVHDHMRQAGARYQGSDASAEVPVFNRSFVYQFASTFSEPTRSSLERLAQSVLAAPLAWSEDSAASYGDKVEELVLIDGVADPDDAPLCRVEAVFDVKIGLPPWGPERVKLIRQVRESDAGVRLRASMRNAPTGASIGALDSAWREVAGVLEVGMVKKDPLTLRGAVVSIGTETVTGAVLGGTYDALTSRAVDVESLLRGSGAGAVMGLSMTHLWRAANATRQRDTLRSRLQEAVKFRSVRIAMPTFLPGLRGGASAAVGR